MDNELNNNLNELNSSELKILKDLVNVTEEIVDIYDKLYYLEINGMKNSDKYNDIIEKLKLALIEEDNIYEDIEGEFDLASKILNNLVTDYLQFEDYIYLVFNYQKDKAIISRMSYRLEDIICRTPLINEENISDEELTEEELEELEQLDINYEDNYDEEYMSLSEIEVSVENDIVNTILTILNKYINDSKYENIHYELVRYKYLLSLIFTDIEEDLINNNFEINNMLFWKCFAVNTINNEPNETVRTIISDYVNDIMQEQLALITDYVEEAEIDYVYYKLIISQIIIRACMMFAEKEVRNNIICLAKDDTMELTNPNKQVIDIINNSFNQINLDRELPYKIVLKPKN